MRHLPRLIEHPEVCLVAALRFARVSDFDHQIDIRAVIMACFIGQRVAGIVHRGERALVKPDFAGAHFATSHHGVETDQFAMVWMDGDAVTMTYAPDVQADRAVLVVTDAAGKLVSREDVPLSAAPYQWLGGDLKGDPLPAGLYTTSLESYRGEDLLSTTEVESYARILEARGGAKGTTLVLEGGVEVAATKVTALRVP